MEKAQADCQGILSQIQLTKQLLTESQERIQAVCERIFGNRKSIFLILYTISFQDGQESFLSSCAKIGQISEIEKQHPPTSAGCVFAGWAHMPIKRTAVQCKSLLTLQYYWSKRLRFNNKSKRCVRKPLLCRRNSIRISPTKKQIESIYQKIEKNGTGVTDK